MATLDQHNLEAAKQVAQQVETLKLNPEDSEVFVDALLNPPKPSERLKAAAQRYKQAFTKI